MPMFILRCNMQLRLRLWVRIPHPPIPLPTNHEWGCIMVIGGSPPPHTELWCMIVGWSCWVMGGGGGCQPRVGRLHPRAPAWQLSVMGYVSMWPMPECRRWPGRTWPSQTTQHTQCQPAQPYSALQCSTDLQPSTALQCPQCPHLCWVCSTCKCEWGGGSGAGSIGLLRPDPRAPNAAQKCCTQPARLFAPRGSSARQQALLPSMDPPAGLLCWQCRGVPRLPWLLTASWLREGSS